MTGSEPEAATQPGLGVLVLRALGVAALVVGVSAALFWTVGQGGEDGPVVADGPDQGAGESAGEDGTAGEDAGDPAPDEGDGAGTDEPAGGDTGSEQEQPAEPDPEPEPGEPADPDPDPEPDPEPDPDPDPEPDPDPNRIDPSTISVQVLDGYQADGGAAAAVVTDELAQLGYRIIAQNPAIAYQVTTVLWTAGSQAAAEQVARDLGAPEVREQPGNLADSVMVHVVVGADRG